MNAPEFNELMHPNMLTKLHKLVSEQLLDLCIKHKYWFSTNDVTNLPITSTAWPTQKPRNKHQWDRSCNVFTSAATTTELTYLSRHALLYMQGVLMGRSQMLDFKGRMNENKLTQNDGLELAKTD